MSRTTSKTFELIPSVQSRADLPAPIAFVPALPVRLQEVPGVVQYAVVDTGAKISSISSVLIPDIGSLKQSVVRQSIIAMAEGRLTVEIVKFSIILCDVGFSPWLRLKDVPFVLLPGKEPSTQSSIVLGVDDCLSNLRLDIDFPNRRIKVLASSRFLASENETIQPNIPSRIKEGEKLIEFGSYNAAVAMIAAGLEESLINFTGTPLEDRGRFGEWHNFLARGEMGADLRKEIIELMNIRNRAVHGPLAGSISEEDARKVLQKAKAIIRQLAKPMKGHTS
jgi:hypothetical protein